MKNLGYRLLFVDSFCQFEQVINSLVVFKTINKAIEEGMKYLNDIPTLKGFVVLKVLVFKQGIFEISEKVYSYVR